MTVILPDEVIQSILNTPLSTVMNVMGLVAVFLLLLLVVERVLIEAYLERPRAVVVLGFNIAMLPLMFVLGVLLFYRFALIIGIIRG